MKTKEFIRKVEKLGYKISGIKSDYDYMVVKDKGGDALICIGKKSSLNLTTDYHGFKILPIEIKRDLYELGHTYASTPIEDRVDEKRYLVKVPYVWNWGEDRYFRINSYVLGGSNVNTATRFTEKEIEKYRLESFETDEVTDEY